ncbi:oligopeptide transport system ATP-binding protein [Sporomusaceae bacterium BoRhaA]|uniref:ABC transporter ATP-binding protein n=1 Tax=Pelorhabdus rhamnosifermentans TaxID=2772457 RepID=UPI001C0614CC|nr:dipeptide ABC transporter ATP-binding protein [Pelorhabdus rhamnosifermentans]MBU2699005.1 oligopeptide transport system ATP-binding protein [Pelorhabdus rhamnosifermentans]
MRTETLLEVRNLKKHFAVATNFFGRTTAQLKAVDDVSFSIAAGETLGLVGESGCGKSTTGRTIIGLYQPTAGQVLFKGQELLGMGAQKNLYREIQMIFQDPYASLNPRMTVGDIVGEPLDIHHLAQGKARTKRIQELLQLVGLNAEHANRFPHEFSGGQRQRIGIARALAVNPSLIICDEPISALDVSIQAQVVNLLENLQRELGLTYLFIAHDLAMVKYISRRVAVMYLGKIVELAETNELYSSPRHPYTQALLSAIPIPDPEMEAKRERICLQGDVPNPIHPPSGCHFRTRCPYAMPVCTEKEPDFAEAGNGHSVACHLITGCAKHKIFHRVIEPVILN